MLGGTGGGQGGAGQQRRGCLLQVVALMAVFPKGRVSDQLAEAEKTASRAKALQRGTRL